MDSSHKKRNGASKQQDSKKDTAGTVRQVPRNARRREAKGGSAVQEHHHQPQLRNNNNNANQQQQQHYRNNNERRSKWSKTSSSSSFAPGDEATGLATPDDSREDNDLDHLEDIYLEHAEWDSVVVTGSKKHNLNHLLNFHYTPRDMPQPQRGGTAKQQGRAAKSVSSHYNKDQFLQANCQFIVKDSGDYKQHRHNPDSLVDWQHIEEVVIRSAEEPQCPICLFPPVAAKMTKCGHVYCWPCILHYLALSDKEWRKCPICYDAVRIKDLRSTVAWPYHEYQMHETIDFQLMCRRKASLEVFKVAADGQQPSEGVQKPFPHLFDIREQQVCHSKLILANKLEVTSIVDRERCELQTQMRTDGPEGFDCPETMFISQALDLLQERANQVKTIPPSPGDLHTSDVSEMVADSCTEEDDCYYFYQAIDGQLLYMHSINLRMLQAQFGTLAHCPPVLTGRIVQREHFSVSEALRKKSKYLQHLPLTSIITVVEVSFQAAEDVLFSEAVLEQFADELSQRKRDRQRRVRDEKKRERKINDMNERELGRFMRQSSGFVREDEDFYPFLTTEMVQVEEGAVGGSEEVERSDTTVGGSPNTPFSFARMLQCTSEMEKAQPQFWPTLENKRVSGGSAATTGWPKGGGGGSENGNKPKASKMDIHFPNLLDTIEVEDQDNNNAPGEIGSPPLSTVSPLPSKATFRAAAAAAATVGPKGNAAASSFAGLCSGGAASKRTPKKKQQMLLFSTDMNFNRN